MAKRIVGIGLLLIAILFLIKSFYIEVGWALGLSIGVVWALVVLFGSCLIYWSLADPTGY